MSFFAAGHKERRRALRVGLFMALALGLAGGVVFLIGQQTRLFDKQVMYRAYFESVEGLSDESPVWLGGLEVGRVAGVSFSKVPGEKRLEVQLELSSRYAERIRADSVVRLASQGVLGDKALDITVGSLTAAAMPEGSVLPVVEGGDLAALMKSASQVMENTVAVSETLREAVQIYADPAMARDVAASVRSLRGLLEEVEKGEGVLHALIYDKQAGREVRSLLANASGAAARMDSAVGEVEMLLRQVRTGDGTAHALLYEKDGARALEELGNAAGELAKLIADARNNPKGAVGQLVYGDAGSMLSDLGSAAASLKEITSTVANGEGSLGGLIKDPTVYEDLKTVLGNVKRNRVLRALVRFSINNRQDLEQVGQPQKPPRSDESQQGTGGAGKEPQAPLK
jgi:phospholipid/cholesterol/gamma-HCH transport system substrate-binding protein